MIAGEKWCRLRPGQPLVDFHYGRTYSSCGEKRSPGESTRLISSRSMKELPYVKDRRK
jgi:hypothetical protein